MRYDEGGNQLRVARLSDRGVKIWGAEQVYISDDVVLDNIESGAEIYNGTLSGPELRIGRRTKIGVSGPARIENCQIGRDCSIGAGVYDDATILDLPSEEHAGADEQGSDQRRPGGVVLDPPLES